MPSSARKVGTGSIIYIRTDCWNVQRKEPGQRSLRCGKKYKALVTLIQSFLKLIFKGKFTDTSVLSMMFYIIGSWYLMKLKMLDLCQPIRLGLNSGE